MAKKNMKKAAKKPTPKTKKPATKVMAKKTGAKKPTAKKVTAKKTAAKKADVKKIVAKQSSAKSAKSSIASKTATAKSTIKVSAKTIKSSANKSSKIDFNNWVTPLDDRILVQVAAEERTTPGGLFIPDTVADVSGNFKGNVVAVGRGHQDKKGKVRPLDVKTGDVVVFSQFSGSKVEYQGETVIFLREADVLGIVNK